MGFAVLLSEAKDLCNLLGIGKVAWILRFAQDDILRFDGCGVF
jgi:hypothetical protein